MKFRISKGLAAIAILAGISLSVTAEDLDAALAAQKKKAVHRTYSENALIENRNLTVPRSETEEDRQLDKKLREMEAKQNAQPTVKALQATPQSATSVPRPSENKNWLTAAVLDDSAAKTSKDEPDENAWLIQELTRQKELKDQAAALSKENEAVDKLLREKMDKQNNRQESDPLKKYKLAAPQLFGDKRMDTNAPAYNVLRDGTPDPMTALRTVSRREKSTASAPFSPGATRNSTSTQQNPLRPQPTTPAVNPAIPVRKSSSVSSYDRNDSKPAPLTPIEMIRKSSPINRPDPFAENPSPTFKNSIWQ
ncbi:MAG: hypothetical protein IT583_02940 [Verrucomicrobia bacterium]|nr:hypothetical protein [Verrucomicrobiota bacterium]